VLFILFTVGSGIYDGYLVKDKKKYIKNHTPRWILRATVATILSVGHWYLLPVFAGIFILLFDSIYGLYVHKDFWYLGKTAKWDIFWRKRYKLYKILKISAPILGAVLGYLMFIII